MDFTCVALDGFHASAASWFGVTKKVVKSRGSSSGAGAVAGAAMQRMTPAPATSAAASRTQMMQVPRFIPGLNSTRFATRCSYDQLRRQQDMLEPFGRLP